MATLVHNRPKKPNQPLNVFEDLSATPRYHLFDLFGVRVEATSYAWLSYISMLSPALVLAYLFYPQSSTAELIVRTVGWAILLWSSLWIHSIGHIVSGKIAGSVMDRLLITATRQLTLYDGDQEKIPARVHITRALGGPVGNVLVGLVGVILMVRYGMLPALLVFTLPNLAGISALAPVESVDGGTIAHYLGREWVKQRAPSGRPD